MKSFGRTRTWKRVQEDPVLAGALAFALVATAHAEYTLATATHVHPWVAIAVPGALDLYVIRALARGKDVLLAVLLMVAANVTSHLIAADVLAVDWKVISAVGALAPLLLWRVHALARTRNRVELLWGKEAGASDALAEPGAESAPDQQECAPALAPSAPHSEDAFGPMLMRALSHSPDAPVEYHQDACDGLHPLRVACSEHTALAPSAPDHVPAEWSAPVLHLPTSPEFTALQPGDEDYLPEAKAYVATTPEPSVRGFMKVMRMAGRGIGQKRAERLLTHLGAR